MTERYDAIIIGGGHNGLVCGFYLARAGMRVRVLERRGVVGGAAVTEEFAPGFRNSTASYTVSLLQPRVIHDMKLHARGYRVIARPIANFLPLEDGRSLKVGGGLARTQAEFAKFSDKDAETLPAYYATIEAVADVLRDLALKIPPEGGGGLTELARAALQGRAAAKLPIERQRDLLALFTKSARELLDGWFESAPVKAAFGFDAVVGNYARTDAPGSAYVLLHHVFGEVNGAHGAWGHAVGGMGAITRAMAEAAREAGCEISLDAPVARVRVEHERAVGVRRESGEKIAAGHVIANVGPKLLYGRMIDEEALPADFARRMKGYAVGSGTLRMNVALSELPRFTAMPESGEHLQAGIVMAPSLDYMDRAYEDARADGWAKRPVVEMLIPSTVDDSLAPPGSHVASLFCQHVDPMLPEADEDNAADAAIDVVERFAPGFRASIVARQVHGPASLERKFGLIGGDIFHGRMSLDQLWAARPVLGAGAYRGPLKGLYMCGAGTHPGGGVTGAPGHNAARAVLADRRWRR